MESGKKLNACANDREVLHRNDFKLSSVPENSDIKSFEIPSKSSLVHLSFKNVSYTVSKGFFCKKRKILLDNISGKFYGGKLTAVIGPSGAGKSTLINILSGYTTTNFSGSIFVNGKVREEYRFINNSCYIMQNENLQPLLTVLEAMTVSANLKLPTLLSTKEKFDRIEEVLKAINLWEYKSIKTLLLSGGQKKRLSLALELINNPQVILIDEPTSGLDSLTSKQCIKLLRDMAQTGKTVICSIHQPSAMILDLFDYLYVLANGQCIYQGAVRRLLPYLKEVKLKCPSYHNPADYVLEIATGEHGEYINELVKKSENGNNEDWKEMELSPSQLKSYENIKTLMASGKITPVQAPANVFLFPTEAMAEFKILNTQQHCFCKERYPTTFSYQLITLLKRASIKIYRDTTLTYNRIFTHLGVAVFLGILCYGIGEDGSKSMTNFNLMFFSVMFLMFTAFNSVVTTFSSEMAILTQEYFNKWYCLKSYYIAVSVADIPIQVVATLIFSSVTYYLTKQPLEVYRICAFLFMCVLISLTAHSFGLFVGACMDLKNAVIFGPFCLLPFTIFSGFFVKLSDCPNILRWLFHISFLKYGLEGLMLSVFGYERSKMLCKEEYCHYVHPKKILKERDMDNALYLNAVMFLLVLNLFLKLIGYFALKLQTKARRREY